VRALVVLLLLGNAAFFAWSQWVARPAGKAPPPRAAAASRIVLASEAPAAPPLPTLRLEPGVSCVSIGPFPDLTEAARASTTLRSQGLLPRQRSREGVVWSGFWVALKDVASGEDADQIVERLRQFGIADAYRVPDEEQGATISLGLYSERQVALNRADEVRALGYQPYVEERERFGTVYWIDVDVRSPSQMPDPASFDGSGRIVRLEVTACDLEGRTSVPLPPAGVPDGVPG
jgi:hypothetical protein